AWFAVAGAPAARAVAGALVGILGGRILPLREGEGVGRTYHAAAALLAGGTVALFAAAEEVLAATLADPSLARPALLALLASAVAPLAAEGPAGALTGPTARGSLEVVRGHLASLFAADPDAARLYALLARRMVALAESRGSIDAGRRAALERLLELG
ncbi:MAG: DUF2520 domain-containing protein, partial [Planctomycetota bacterium]